MADKDKRGKVRDLQAKRQEQTEIEALEQQVKAELEQTKQELRTVLESAMTECENVVIIGAEPDGTLSIAALDWRSRDRLVGLIHRAAHSLMCDTDLGEEM